MRRPALNRRHTKQTYKRRHARDTGGLMSTQDKKYYTISVIPKVCAIIETLATKKSWELSALCRATGIPKTTVHRILLTLEDGGYIIQEKTRGEYSLSYKLFSLGSKAVSHDNIVDMARPYCRSLLEAVDETVNLCVVSGIEMLVIDKQVTSQTLRQDSIVGSSFPLFYSASGKVMLAFLSPEEAEKKLDTIKRQTKGGIPEGVFKKLRQELEEVRATGLAFDYEEVFPGVRCVASPIFDFQNTIAATVSISTPTVRLTQESAAKIEQELLIASEKISVRLGASWPKFAPLSSQSLLTGTGA